MSLKKAQSFAKMMSHELIADNSKQQIILTGPNPHRIELKIYELLGFNPKHKILLITNKEAALGTAQKA